MIPHTYPSTYATPNGQQQMVVMFLSDVAGKQKWLDYIPVKLQGTVPNTYDNNGFIPVVATTATGETVPFKDYVPVFVDSSATDAWQVNNVGYIPYNYLSFSSAALNLDLLSGSLDSRVTFTRASGATRFNASGVLETVATNVPRFDYDPVTLAPRGLLIEGARTNLALHSEAIDNAIWFKAGGVSVSANAGTSPAGTEDAELATITSSTFGREIQQSVSALAVGTTYTLSVWVKPNSSFTGVFQLAYYDSATALNTTGITLTGTDWRRLSFTFTVTTLATAPRIRILGFANGAVGESLFIWGAQLEVGAFASSYIPTTSSQVTRAADVAVMTGTNFSSWYNQTEGTFFAEFSTQNNTPSAWPSAVSVDPNAVQRGHSVGFANNSTGLIRPASASRDASGLVEAASAAISAGLNTKVAGVVSNDLRNVSANGQAVVSNTVVRTVPSVTHLRIGWSQLTLPSVDNLLFGHIRRIAYWNTRLTNAELQSLTS